MSNSNILLGKHHDITAFASKDDARYILQSVHYNHAKKRVEATDGAVCIHVPVVEDGEGAFPPVSVNGVAEDCIIPVKAFQKALGNIPKSGLPIASHLRLSVSTKGEGEKVEKQINLCSTDLETEQNVGVKGITGDYPNLDAVMPTESAKYAFVISAYILKQIADYAERHGKQMARANGQEDCPVKLEFINEISPMRFSFPLDTPLGHRPNLDRATGVAMPMRLT